MITIRTIAAYMAAGALLLSGARCTMNDNLAGGGTDVSNPVVVGKALTLSGDAASNTRVTLIPARYNALIDNPLPASMTDTTDASGAYVIAAPAAGIYNIEAVHMPTGYKFFVTNDTLRQKDTLFVPADTLRQPGYIKILFTDTAYATYGYVYIPGSTMSALIQSGYPLIDAVPAGVIPVINYANLVDAKKNHIVQAGITVAPGAGVTMADFYSWKYSRQLSLNTTASGAGVARNVYNFPVLIRLNSSFDFSQAKQHGEDIRFAKPDNSPLAFEIDKWDYANKQAAIWVKMDTVYGNSGSQRIVMRWGNQAAVDQSNSTAVFDTADGFKAVWHLTETSGSTAREATYDNYRGTYNGTLPRNASGAVGGCQSLDGNGDFIDMGSNALNPSLNNLSLSAWIKLGDSGKTTTIVAKSKGGDTPGVYGAYYGYILAIDWNSFPHFYLADGGASWGDPGSLDLMADMRLTDRSSWHHLFVVIDRSGNSNCKMYIDGVDRTPGALNGDILTVGPIANTLPLRIGIEADAGYPYKGSIDEIVMAYTVRSADWVKLCYMNQKPVDALVVFQ